MLVVDDDELLLRAWERRMRGRCLLFQAKDREEALEVVELHEIDVAIVDLWLGATSGIGVMREIRERQPGACAVLVSSRNSVEVTVEAMRAGAFTSKEKPVDPLELLSEIEQRPATEASPSLAAVQAAHLQRVLAQCDGNKTKAASILGVRRTTIQRMLKKNPPAK